MRLAKSVALALAHQWTAVEASVPQTVPRLIVEARGAAIPLFLSKRIDDEGKPARRNTKPVEIAQAGTITDEVEAATRSEHRNQPVGPSHVLIRYELILRSRSDPTPGDGEALEFGQRPRDLLAKQDGECSAFHAFVMTID